MTRALPRAHLNSSRLVRYLTENHMADAAPTGDDVGQKLGDWLNFRQAIALHGVLHPEPVSPSPAARMQKAVAVAPEALTRHVQKLRAQLEESIMLGAPPGSGLSRIEMPQAELEEPVDIKTAFEAYRRFYAAHQRQMESSVQKLRAQVRTQLHQRGGAFQNLAELDAAFETILNEREAALLAKMTSLHEKRFVQTLKQHLQKQALATATTTSEASEPSSAPDSALASSRASSHATWLMPLRQSMRLALMAELDTRLQPTLGLLEALNAHSPRHT